SSTAIRSCPRPMAGQAERSGNARHRGRARVPSTVAALLAGRRDGAVRGYRKARDVRSLELGQILNTAVAPHLHRLDVADHHAAHFATGEVAAVAGLEQATLDHVALGIEDLHPAVFGK